MREHYEEHCVQHLENERRFIFLCRLYPCLQHYVVIVCFSWLACEGLYLVLLQQRPAVLFERVKPLRWFVAVSWLLPGLIVAIWALMMLQRPNGEFSCFDTDKYIIVSHFILAENKGFLRLLVNYHIILYESEFLLFRIELSSTV